MSDIRRTAWIDEQVALIGTALPKLEAAQMLYEAMTVADANPVGLGPAHSFTCPHCGEKFDPFLYLDVKKSVAARPPAQPVGEWTSEKPTKAGWYWFRGVVGDDDFTTTIAWVHEINGHLKAMWLDGAADRIAEVAGEWIGPLLPPSPADPQFEKEDK